MADLINKKIISSLFPKRIQNSHKYTNGKILNVAGASIYPGAAYLSSISPLKIGAGFVALACVKSIIHSIVTMSPEITFIPLNEDESGCIDSNNEINDLISFNVISIGCGITTNLSTEKFIIDLLSKINERQRVIIDADGLNILSVQKNEISLKNVIITPHEKELARLLNVSVAEVHDNREKYARIMSQTHECITVLKGKNTIITDGVKMYINTTGNSALAKAGTGDVLTGIISGLLAQKLKPLDAAIVGVYIHGLAGDIASSVLSEYSVMASDVINYLPYAIKKIIVDE